MNVAHIISGGEVGGSKKHLLSLAEEMKIRKTKNIIICFIKGKLYEEALRLGLDVYLVTQSKRFDLSVVGKIKEICSDNNVDIITSHGGRANFICFFLKKTYNARFITVIHSDYESDYKGNNYKTFIYTRINKMALKSFDYYIAVSESFKNLLINRGFNGDKIFTIHNGIDVNAKLSTLSREEIITKHSLPIYDRYISMVARMHPIKGHKDFFNALESISHKLHNTCILLVGDGDYLDSLKEYLRNMKIKDNIVFLGFKSPEDFYNICDFTVLTSHSESFPLVILESGLYNKTVIASNVGGIGEIIRDNYNGLLIEPGNKVSIASAIEYLIDNKEARESMGNNLHNDILNKFSIKALGDSYEKIWNNILLEE
ncbi:MAG: glycosyltransferase family 4 protein [Clostridium sp.]|uniref:glycosyltransferase family 4 protein n=1 Tax=Clostridium sp. TaxID=1506 RepID=UPI002FC7FD6D